jgi:Leucine-rich repeat (LRR) protein
MSSGVKLYYIDQNLEELPKIPNNCIELYCNNNKIKELPENLPDNIKELDCSNNQITELPEKLPQFLETLKISNNQITELPNLSLLYRIRNLYCAGNKIKTIDLSETRIQLLDISFNTELETLKITDNITSLHLDINQFDKFYENILPKKAKIFLTIYIPIGTNKTFYKKSTLGFSGARIIENYNITNFSNNIKKNIITKYNLGNSYKIASRIEGGGNKTVKKNKNPKKINMKKSELQKIALKNKVSLKKRDGTMKKKDELIKSLKLKKLL